MPGACAVSDREKVVLSWSGGKDSTMALYELRRSARYEVVALLTTVAGEFDRVSHHGVRVELLEQQAAAVGGALRKLYLPPDRCTNEEDEALMERTMREYREAGGWARAFGGLFLEERCAYS